MGNYLIRSKYLFLAIFSQTRKAPGIGEVPANSGSQGGLCIVKVFVDSSYRLIEVLESVVSDLLYYFKA